MGEQNRNGRQELALLAYAKQGVETAQRKLRDQIIDAYEADGRDFPVAEIARAAGITRERVHQIVREGRRL